MARVFRNVGAVIAGFMIASLVMTAVESINGHVLYPDLGKAAQGVTDREQIRALFAGAPIGALLVVLGGWMLASVVGGFVTAWIAGSSPLRLALALGLLLTLAGIAHNLMLPPPAWFWIATLVVFLPACFAGARLAPAKPQGV
jgi:hypothetical protein